MTRGGSTSVKRGGREERRVSHELAPLVPVAGSFHSVASAGTFIPLSWVGVYVRLFGPTRQCGSALSIPHVFLRVSSSSFLI